MATTGSGVRIASLNCDHGTVRAVREVDLDIAPGSRVALTGTNGSGKSTLLRAIIGLHRPSAGTIAVDGHVARTGCDLVRRKWMCAWIPQRQAPGAFPLLVRELLEAGTEAAAAHRAANGLGVGGLLDRPVGTLSGGQLQRVHLARTIGRVACGAGLVLADEPTAALDFEARREAAARLLGFEGLFCFRRGALWLPDRYSLVRPVYIRLGGPWRAHRSTCGARPRSPLSAQDAM